MPWRCMKRLAKSLELSSCAAALRRAEDRRPGGAEQVDHAGGQRRLGPDDGEIDGLRRANSASSAMSSLIGNILHARLRARCRHCPARHSTFCHARRTAPASRPARARARPTADDQPPCKVSRPRIRYVPQCRKWRNAGVTPSTRPCSSAAAIDFVVAHRAAGLDHRLGAGLGGHVDAVAEREERIGGHDRAAQRQAGVLRLDRGDARAVDAAHLARADAQGVAVCRRTRWRWT